MHESTHWHILWNQAWGLASTPTAILPVLTGTIVVGLGPIGRGLGNMLSGRRNPLPSDPDLERTLQALAEQAERLDFIERALVGIRHGTVEPAAVEIAGARPS